MGVEGGPAVDDGLHLVNDDDGVRATGIVKGLGTDYQLAGEGQYPAFVFRGAQRQIIDRTGEAGVESMARVAGEGPAGRDPHELLAFQERDGGLGLAEPHGQVGNDKLVFGVLAGLEFGCTMIRLHDGHGLELAEGSALEGDVRIEAVQQQAEGRQ